MICPNSACQKEVTPDSYFCHWCDYYIPAPGAGTKPNLFARFVAFVIDPMIAVGVWFLVTGFLVVVLPVGPVEIFAIVFLFMIGYFVWFLSGLKYGVTPGKKLMGLRVVKQQTGEIPGFGTMFLREIVGRFLSGLVFGLGYLWALFDKNGQAWHDKLAGTVVLKTAPTGTVMSA